MKPYPKYKDSGIEWLGVVPVEWSIIRTDSVTDYIRNQINPEDIKSELVFHYSIPVVQETGTGQLEPTEDLGSAKQLITKKTILVSKLNPRKATICIAEPQDMVTICSSEFVAIKATKCDIEYLYYLFNSEKNRQRLDASVQSVTRSHQRVYPSDIYKFWTALPDCEEQQAIAAYLDRETARIDALIQKKERLIELLKEKRIALITQAVTKGLDPNAPMNDSGIEWLGEVPEHWDVKRVRYLVKVPLQYGAIESAELEDPDLPRYIRITDIDENGSLRSEGIKTIPWENAKPFLLNHGDLLLARSGATAGKTLLWKSKWGTAAFAGYLIRATFNKHIKPEYISYFTASKTYQNWLAMAFIQSTIQNISAEKYKELLVPHPDLLNQEIIISYLDKETAKVVKLIDTVLLSISLLREYRASLIHHAVTGKIDLRDHGNAYHA